MSGAKEQPPTLTRPSRSYVKETEKQLGTSQPLTRGELEERLHGRLHSGPKRFGCPVETS